jgi:hypothetical protein
VLHPLIRPKRLRRGLRGLGSYGLGDFVSDLAGAIQTFEGWYPGSLSYRNNNPGNLRPGSLAVGATGSNGGYAVFPDYNTGWNALLGLIQSSTYYGDTLTQFFQTYAPAADNNKPAAYAAGVAANLGVDPNTPISQLEAGGGSAASTSSSSSDGSGDTDDSSESITDQISDALGGIPTWTLGVAAALLGLALVL